MTGRGELGARALRRCSVAGLVALLLALAALAALGLARWAPERSVAGGRAFCTHGCDTVAVVFSRDRALQVDGLLRSLLWHTIDPERLAVVVLAKTTHIRSTAQYEVLDHAWSAAKVQLVEERDFALDLLGVLDSTKAHSPDASVLFLVDDTLFLRAWSVALVADALREVPEAIGFSLRLGENTDYCFSLHTNQSIPSPRTALRATVDRLRWASEDETVRYSWKGCDADFGYPLEVSSSVYRMDQVYTWFARGADPVRRIHAAIRNPNTLEGVLASYAATDETLPAQFPNLLMHRRSRAMSMPLNLVQAEYTENRAGLLDAEQLASLYDRGYRVDVAVYAGHVPRAAHEVQNLYLRSLLDSSVIVLSTSPKSE